MLALFHAEADDGFLAKRLGGFQPVSALDQHETRAVRTHQDWCLLAMLAAIRPRAFARAWPGD
jgi:hypothetical protein